MSVHKRGGSTYHYEFQYQGRRYRGTTGQENELDARDVEATARLRVRRQAHGIETGPEDSPSFQDWAEIYYATIRKRVKRPEAQVFLIRNALRFWGAKPTEAAKVHPKGEYHDLRLGDVVSNPGWILKWEEWLDRRGWSAQTKNHHRSVLHQFFQLAISPLYRRQTGITTNPFTGQWRDQVRGRESVLSKEDLSAILEAASWHLRLAIAIAMLTPKFRIGNILALTWAGHVSPDYSRLSVAEHKTDHHTGRPLVAHVPEQLREILKEARRRDPKGKYVVTYQGRRIHQLSASVAGAVKRAATNPQFRHLTYGRDTARGITFHTLRHTAATFLADMNVSPDKRQQILGHRSIGSTMRYTHLSEHEATTAELLSVSLPLKDLVLAKGRRPRKTA